MTTSTDLNREGPTAVPRPAGQVGGRSIRRIAFDREASPAGEAARRWAEHTAAATSASVVGVGPDGRALPGHPLAPEVTGARPDGDVVRELLRAATREDADLLVIGVDRIHDRSPWPCTTALAVVGAGVLDVVLVPPMWNRTTRCILVGDDGSPAADRASIWAARLAIAARAELHLVRSYRPFVPTPPEQHAATSAADAELEAVRAAVLPVGHELVQDDHPSTSLRQAANRLNADLVVVGARGAGGFADLRVGGTARDLIRYANRPVAVIH